MHHYDNSRAFDNYDAWLTTDPSLDRDDPPINDCVIDLVVELLGDDGTPWKFYRSIYKSTPCGPSIGFLLQNPDPEPMEAPDDPPTNWTPLAWIYCDDLPNTPIAELDAVAGVCVGSIVDGSDAEVPTVEFVGEFNAEDFWHAVAETDKQADFFWKRDNTRQWIIHYRSPLAHEGPSLEYFIHYTEFDDGYTWDEGTPPNAVVKLKIEAFLTNKTTAEYDEEIDIPGMPGWNAVEYLNEAEY